MNTTEIRDLINEYAEQLPDERLRVVADFMAYLVDKESEEATEELLAIPGLSEKLEKAEKDFAEGRFTPVEKLKRKY